jgi:hypothetical protein
LICSSGKAYLEETIRAAIGAMSADGGLSMAFKKALRDAGPALRSFAQRTAAATGVEGWHFEIDGMDKLAESFAALDAARLVQELCEANGSVFRYAADAIEEICKDSILKEAFVEATSGKSVKLSLSARVNTSGRAIGAAFEFGSMLVLQQEGQELGGGKAYLKETIEAALDKLSVAGRPTLALRRAMRDLSAQEQASLASLAAATGLTNWKFETDWPRLQESYPSLDAKKIAEAVLGQNGLLRAAATAVQEVCADALKKETLQAAVMSRTVALVLTERPCASGRETDALVSEGRLELRQQEGAPEIGGGRAYFKEMLEAHLNRLEGALPMDLRVRVRDGNAPLQAQLARWDAATGKSGWSFEMDVAAFHAAFPGAGAKLIDQAYSASDSIMKYLTDAVCELCKDGLLKEELNRLVRDRRVAFVLCQSAPSELSVRLENDRVEIRQKENTELGHRKAYLGEMLPQALMAASEARSGAKPGPPGTGAPAAVGTPGAGAGATAAAGTTAPGAAGGAPAKPAGKQPETRLWPAHEHLLTLTKTDYPSGTWQCKRQPYCGKTYKVR